jgi:hypothetical protein
LSGGAAAAGHRDRAQIAESTGHTAQAAKEYEQAYAEEGAPDLLYRLGVVRRKLKQYELGQEAFRGYLRVAPEGPFRDEVMRQLSEIGVLLEEQHRQVPDELRKKPQPSRKNVPVKGLTPPPATPAPPSPSATASLAPAVDPASGLDEPPAAASASPTSVAEALTAEIAAAPAPADAQPDSVETLRTAVPAAALPESSLPVPAPAAATGVSTTAQHDVSVRSRAAPWVAAGAAALAIGGAALWWHGDSTASDLDARFASGDLSPADNGAYGRAHTESVAGRAMVAGAVVLGALAVALWW